MVAELISLCYVMRHVYLLWCVISSVTTFLIVQLKLLCHFRSMMYIDTHVSTCTRSLLFVHSGIVSIVTVVHNQIDAYTPLIVSVYAWFIAVAFWRCGRAGVESLRGNNDGYAYTHAAVLRMTFLVFSMLHMNNLTCLLENWCGVCNNVNVIDASVVLIHVVCVVVHAPWLLS